MLEFSDPAVYLSWLIFLPAIVALVIAFLPARGETIKWISLGATIVVALMSLRMLSGGEHVQFKAGVDKMQNLFAFDWIPSSKSNISWGPTASAFRSSCSPHS